MEKPAEEFRHMTTINVCRPEKEFHNIGIIMGIEVSDDPEIRNCEPEKNEYWKWTSWEEFEGLEPKFYPFERLAAKGYGTFERLVELYDNS